jgi:ABC-type nitrate/sulfonate/bicarbonate transport system substrate-binding protein
LNRGIFCALILAGIIMTACSAQAATVGEATAAPSTGMLAKSRTIRFAMLDSKDVKDVPWLMALDSLAEQGYSTQVVNFGKSSLIAPALIQGDVDIASISTFLSWAARTKGASIATIVGKVTTSYYLVTDREIGDCSDLEGKAVTFDSRQSVGYLMFEEYVARKCPGLNPEILPISGSANRVAGLELGEVDAAYLELEHWLRLQEIAPDQFHVLIDFAKEFPDVQVSTFSVRREWAEENREQVEEFVRELLMAQRGVIADPELLREGIVRYLAIDAGQAQALAEVYLQKGMWDPNGQLTLQNIQATLDFFSAEDMLPADLKVEDVADLSYLDAVLSEMGRQ